MQAVKLKKAQVMDQELVYAASSFQLKDKD